MACILDEDCSGRPLTQLPFPSQQKYLLAPINFWLFEWLGCREKLILLPMYKGKQSSFLCIVLKRQVQLLHLHSFWMLEKLAQKHPGWVTEIQSDFGQNTVPLI